MNHAWVRMRQLFNRTWLWECSTCKSETWTLSMAPPKDGDLENSRTLKDCEKAGEMVRCLGKTFGQPEALPKTAWERLDDDTFT